MKTSIVPGLILGSIITIGCAHNASSGSPVAALVVPTTTPAPVPDASSEPKPDENFVQLNAYRAIGDLQRYVDDQGSSAIEPEQLIEGAWQAVKVAAQGNPQAENQYLLAQCAKLEVVARLRYATFMVEDLRTFANSGTLTSRTAQEAIVATRHAVARAEQNNAGILKLKEELPTLERQARLDYAEKTIWLLQDYVDSRTTAALYNAVKAAEAAVMVALQAGDNAYVLHARFVKLKEAACVINKLVCE
jgi:hypothetical protein